MDPMIKQTIDGMLTGFDHVSVSDPAIQQEIEDYKKEMYALGEKSGDVSTFMTELQTSGLMQKNSDLMTKASQAATGSAQASAPANEAPSAGGGPKKLPTVQEFLEQYKPGYDAAKNHGYQFRAVKAYEALFGVADQTDDLLEMNIILEKDGHLRAIAAEAMYDINKLAYDSTDPNNTGARDQFRNLMELAEDYTTEQELDYRTDKLIQVNQQGSFRHNYKINISAQLGLSLLNYILAKTRVWSCMDLERDTMGFVICRENAARTYKAIQEIFGMDYDDVAKDPWMSKFMLVDQAVEPCGLGSRCMDPGMLDFYREVLFDEVLSDKSDAELLLQPFSRSMHFGIDSRIPEDAAAEAKMTAEVENRLKDRYYYDYQRKVKVVMPKTPGV